MNIRIGSLLVSFLAVLLFRLYQIGGLDKDYTDPTIEDLGSRMEEQRNVLTEAANFLLPQPQAALLSGIVIGAKEDMTADFKKALRNTSTLHMVVVSGQNLTLLAGFFLSFSSVLGKNRTIFLSLGLISFYALISGLEVPVIRATIMIFLASIAKLFGREGESFWILLLTGMGMLIYNPNWILSISFQLSFLATIGVVVVAPEVIKQLKVVPDIIKQDLAVTLSAQVLVLPIIAANFHQISLIGIITNVLVSWTVPIIMITGLLAMIASLGSLFVGQLLVIIPAVLLTFFSYIVLAFDTKFSSLYISSIGGAVWLGYYLMILGGFLFLKRVNRTIDKKQLKI